MFPVFFHGGFCVCQKETADRGIFPQTFQMAGGLESGPFDLTAPGVGIIPGQVIGGMVSCYDHEGSQVNRLRLIFSQKL